MARLGFTWDPGKERANVRKHGISFVEAQSVFFDEHGRLIDDPEHSGSEDRFLLLGMSMALRVLVVVHAYREEAAVVRIISARRATPAERSWYERGGKP